MVLRFLRAQRGQRSADAHSTHGSHECQLAEESVGGVAETAEAI